MLIRRVAIQYYIKLLKNNRYFCFPGYSDAEFFSMMGIRLGNTTGLGQIIDYAHGRKLTDVMRRRQSDSRWLFAIPACLYSLPQLEGEKIDDFFAREGISIIAYERDMVLDELAMNANLHPFIKQLQEMPTLLIGPKEFGDGGLEFLNYEVHIDIPSPNLHMDEKELERTIRRSKGFKGVNLISAGVSSAVIIDKLYEREPNAFYIDCGSIWDAFVGIGGQRQWRADLYANPKALEEWKERNINGY